MCGVKQDPDKQLLCDECDMAFHIYCLNPPLSTIPEDEDWSVAGRDRWGSLFLRRGGLGVVAVGGD